tara:strand:+ start:1544 stop:2698 length:1155 start_codon:yes stop_codon:yes gene_type:complete
MDTNNITFDIQNKLLRWFDVYGRHNIPWKLNKGGSLPVNREILSCYGIWIAEVMLQQTKLKVVLPYWSKWMITFPNLNILAESDEQEILLIWQGLGFYSRAKRIHKCSKILLNLIGKNNTLDPFSWPSQIDKWIQLPGIGRSTAGSIISSAFDLPVPILDGNVKRVLSRVLASNQTPSKDEKRLWKLSSLLVSCERPRDLNQALMDLGATLCTTHNPSCYSCPIKYSCSAFLKYDPVDFPKKELKKTIPIQEIGIGLIFNKDGKLLIDQRLDSSTMGGMWEFPGGKKESDECIEVTIQREIKEELSISIEVKEKLLSFVHSYSHKKLHFTVYICEWKSGQPRALASQKILWITPNKLIDFPFPAANKKIIIELYKYLGIENKKL